MGSSLGWIQGVQIVDGKVREIYREIRKDFADKRIEERKEADITCFTQKANNIPRPQESA